MGKNYFTCTLTCFVCFVLFFIFYILYFFTKIGVNSSDTVPMICDKFAVLLENFLNRPRYSRNVRQTVSWNIGEHINNKIPIFNDIFAKLALMEVCKLCASDSRHIITNHGATESNIDFAISSERLLAVIGLSNSTNPSDGLCCKQVFSRSLTRVSCQWNCSPIGSSVEKKNKVKRTKTNKTFHHRFL